MNDELAARAIALFPDSNYLASQWIRAVEYLRRRGIWLLDKEVLRKDQQLREAV
jgi:hypothetical protein